MGDIGTEVGKDDGGDRALHFEIDVSDEAWLEWAWHVYLTREKQGVECSGMI